MSTVSRRPSRTADRPLLPREPVSVADAGRIGWTRSALRHAVDTGIAERPHRGVVSGTPPADSAAGPVERWRAERDACLLAARAAAVACPRASLSHWPAAIGYGMPTIGRSLRPCVTVDAGTALRDLATVHLHRATLTDEDFLSRDGWLTTTPARTVLDVAREHGVAAGTVTADHALRTGLTSEADLVAALERYARWPGVARARATAALCSPLSESPLESLSRLFIRRSALPAAELQVSICDGDGRFIGRTDFFWDGFGVVGEADGEGKYAGTAGATRAERVRERELQQTGLIVVRWGYADLAQFERVVQRLALAMRRGARPGSPDRRWGRLC